jgi:hypothetical protein
MSVVKDVISLSGKNDKLSSKRQREGRALTEVQPSRKIAIGDGVRHEPQHRCAVADDPYPERMSLGGVSTTK